MEMMKMYVPEDLHERIRLAAAKSRQSVSEWLRAAAESHLIGGKPNDIPPLPPEAPPLPIGTNGTIRTVRLPMNLLLEQGVKWAHTAWVRTHAQAELEKLQTGLDRLLEAYEAGDGTGGQREVALAWINEAHKGVSDRSFAMDAYIYGKINSDKYEAELDSFGAGGDQ